MPGVIVAGSTCEPCTSSFHISQRFHFDGVPLGLGMHGTKVWMGWRKADILFSWGEMYHILPFHFGCGLLVFSDSISFVSNRLLL
jgi:hypothetical protein